jgi:hypothetical protein
MINSLKHDRVMMLAAFVEGNLRNKLKVFLFDLIIPFIRIFKIYICIRMFIQILCFADGD